MKRKSVSLLTEYRLDILDSSKEAIQLVTDLDEHLTNLGKLSPEQIRSTDRESHRLLFADIRKVYRLLGRELTKHNNAAKQLKELF